MSAIEHPIGSTHSQFIPNHDGLYALSRPEGSPWAALVVYGAQRYYVDLKQTVPFRGDYFVDANGQSIRLISGEAPSDEGGGSKTALQPQVLGDSPKADRIELAHGGILELPSAISIIGRDARCDIELQNPSVSSVHCVVLRVDGRTHLFDAQSLNGTRVNQRKVQSAQVFPNDIVECGSEVVRFCQREKKHTSKDLVRLPSPAYQEVERMALRMARSGAPVLIQGETGVGKESVAAALHRYSGRSGRFVAINAAVLSRELAPSTLFGHKKGSFTGADKDAQGAFLEADKGTLFLDEVAELSMEVQAMLLRVLETQEVTAVGAARSVGIQVRVVAATHRNLLKMVEKGLFREDLYHRLCVLPLRIPPLRERKEDIRVLVSGFLNCQNPPRGLSPGAERAILNHSWPGNIRELINTLQRACVVSANPVLNESDIELTATSACQAQLDRIVQEAIAQTYVKNNKNIKKTAEILGIHRTTVSRHLKNAR